MADDPATADAAASAPTAPLTAKQRLIAFANDLPDDTAAVSAVVVDSAGQVTAHGLGVSLHQHASMLIAATIGASEALVTEANGIADAAKTLMSVGLQQALTALNPTATSADHTLTAQPTAVAEPAKV